eukprot:1194964-Prorocentrum_minimum.AAC.4
MVRRSESASFAALLVRGVASVVCGARKVSQLSAGDLLGLPELFLRQMGVPGGASTEEERVATGRGADVVAQEECLVLVIRYDALDCFVAKCPAAGRQLLQVTPIPSKPLTNAL